MASKTRSCNILHVVKLMLQTLRFRTKTFRFFDLPQELRDQIYEMLLSNYERPATNKRPAMKAANFAHPRLCVVSKQFSTEYLARANSLSHLIVTTSPDFKLRKVETGWSCKVSNSGILHITRRMSLDWNGDSIDPDYRAVTLKLPSAALNARSLEIVLPDAADVYKRVWHLPWIRKTVESMRALKEARIRLALANAPRWLRTIEYWPHLFYGFDTIKHIRSVEIHGNWHGGKIIDINFNEDMRQHLALTWDFGTRTWTRVDQRWESRGGNVY